MKSNNLRLLFKCNVPESSSRRLTHFEQMSPPDNARHRTLLDIIRDDRSTKDKKTWKTFRDKLRLKRAGSAWTSSLHVPASDVNVQSSSSRSRSLRSGPHRSNSPHTTHAEDGGERDPPVQFGNTSSPTDHDDSVDAAGAMSSDAPPSRRVKPQMVMVRHPSIRKSTVNGDEDDDDDDYGSSGEEDGSESESAVEAITEERSLSAREAVAAQEAAEAAAKGAEEPVKMSLMDLLGETGYSMGEEGEEYEEEEDDVAVSSRGGMEYTCCVCMVRHKGLAFIPCAHTFCRLCSRELMVQRGNCPLCKAYILEILDIF
ncbi:hypothetical protein like AT3G07120 [Hibiscus trionum]|uniref:RING-type domain-containing protein n=1 Tax=Hibiscus trionum TaxID=183268 RepID=A0A9W7IT61_HIBTR|nr:hypothetical protein like AT3G07120 [Hibiscus trionum]